MDYQVSAKVQQIFDQVMGLEEVKNALDFIEKDAEKSIQEQIELTLIESPTFYEAERAKAYAKYLGDLGLEDAHVDPYGNAVAVWKGAGTGPKVLVEAHLDTVFPFGSVKEVKEENGVLYAPGIVDDTRGLAVLLSALRGLKASGLQTKGDIVFVGTSREEGMGSLGGMKDFLDHNPDIEASISVDGAWTEGITFEATGFKTYAVNFYGIGGHAYGAFGLMANPLHAAARAVAKIADIVTPLVPKTTYCVSNFHAGNDAGVHAIVPEATIKINMRSNGQKELDELKEKVYAAIKAGAEEETARWGKDTITYKIHEYFNVPAGTLDRNDPIVEGIYTIMQYMGKDPIFNEGGPTDAAFPICRGIPAVCIGSGDIETHSHSAANERFPVAVMHQGPQAGFLLAILCGGIEGKFESII